MLKVVENPNTKKEVLSVDFGKVEVGTSKTLTFQLFNDGNSWVTDIKVTFSDPKVQILDLPTELSPYESRPFKLVWKPSMELKKALKGTLEISAVEEFRP